MSGGKVAIVTGAGSGIGRATALRLSERGYAVAVVGRRVQRLEAVAKEISSAGGKPLILSADVSNPNAVQQMVQRTVEAFGRIDLLVNGAGMVRQQPLAEMTVEGWREALEGNLSSAFFCMRAVWPVMKGQCEAGRSHGERDPAGGAIINISSMSARDPFAGLGAYGVAKVGVNMLTLVGAREGHAVGIRVFGVAPGAVDTEMFRGLVGEGKVDPEQVMQPVDVAEVIAAMADGTLRYASGETVYLNRRPA